MHARLGEFHVHDEDFDGMEAPNLCGPDSLEPLIPLWQRGFDRVQEAALSASIRTRVHSDTVRDRVELHDLCNSTDRGIYSFLVARGVPNATAERISRLIAVDKKRGRARSSLDHDYPQIDPATNGRVAVHALLRMDLDSREEPKQPTDLILAIEDEAGSEILILDRAALEKGEVRHIPAELLADSLTIDQAIQTALETAAEATDEDAHYAEDRRRHAAALQLHLNVDFSGNRTSVNLKLGDTIVAGDNPDSGHTPKSVERSPRRRPANEIDLGEPVHQLGSRRHYLTDAFSPGTPTLIKSDRMTGQARLEDLGESTNAGIAARLSLLGMDGARAKALARHIDVDTVRGRRDTLTFQAPLEFTPEGPLGKVNYARLLHNRNNGQLLVSIGIDGRPTLICVDSKGRVRKLPEMQHATIDETALIIKGALSTIADEETIADRTAGYARHCAAALQMRQIVDMTSAQETKVAICIGDTPLAGDLDINRHRKYP